MSVILVIVLIFFTLAGGLGAVAYFTYQKKLRRAKAIERGLKMVPVLIHLPPPSSDTQGENRDLREIMREKTSQAEVLYNLLAGTATEGFKSSFYGQRHIALELIVVDGLVHFYAAVPVALVSVVKKAVQTAYPGSRLEEVEDHNIFNQDGRLAATLGGEMVLKTESAYPIATYEQLERDPMEALLTTVSALEKQDGVAIQIMLRPAGSGWVKKSVALADRMRKGKNNDLKFSALDLAKAAVKAPAERREEERARNGGQADVSQLQLGQVDRIEEKTKHPGFEVLVRVIVSTGSVVRSQQLLRDIATTFALFDSPGLNGFKFLPALDVQGLVTAFIFRFFPNELASNVLSSAELATLFHLPDSQFTPSASVQRQQTKQVDGPVQLPTTGLMFGYNEFRGVRKEIRLSAEDRRRHSYILGQTGTGKSTMLENLAVQDMQAGNGFAFIDPHGDSAEKLLALVPKSRAEDVIYFNPADTQYPLGLNLFEFTDPTQKDFLVQETIGMLYKLYDPGHTGIIGPRYEHWYRNAALTLMSDPNGATFIEIPKVFTDTDYLKRKFKYLKDPTVIDFWTKEMGQTSDYHKSEMLGWFVSKFGAFQNNEMMRNIIGQTKSSFNIREVMDQKKILIVNLSKGRIGELNSQLLGMIFVIKFQAAAMSRADMPEAERSDFALYVDEFQNFSTDSFASILSEARKYRLNLIVANQFIGQLSDPIRDAVFGNIGTIVAHRMGPEDAEFMVRQFAPVFDASDLVNIPNYHAAMRLMIGGLPSQPFSIADSAPIGNVNVELGLAIKQLSAAKYGHDKAVVEADLIDRLSSKPPAAAPVPVPAPAAVAMPPVAAAAMPPVAAAPVAPVAAPADVAIPAVGAAPAVAPMPQPQPPVAPVVMPAPVATPAPVAFPAPPVSAAAQLDPLAALALTSDSASAAAAPPPPPPAPAPAPVGLSVTPPPIGAPPVDLPAPGAGVPPLPVVTPRPAVQPLDLGAVAPAFREAVAPPVQQPVAPIPAAPANAADELAQQIAAAGDRAQAAAAVAPAAPAVTGAATTPPPIGAPPVDLPGDPRPVAGVSVPPAGGGTLSINDITGGGGQSASQSESPSLGEIPLLGEASNQAFVGDGQPLENDPYANIDVLGAAAPETAPRVAEAPEPLVEPGLVGEGGALPDDPYAGVDVLGAAPVVPAAAPPPAVPVVPIAPSAPVAVAVAPQPVVRPEPEPQPVVASGPLPVVPVEPAALSVQEPLRAPEPAPPVEPPMVEAPPVLPAVQDTPPAPEPMVPVEVAAAVPEEVQTPVMPVAPAASSVAMAEPAPRTPVPEPVSPAEPQPPEPLIHFVDPAAESLLNSPEAPSEESAADGKPSLNGLPEGIALVEPAPAEPVPVPEPLPAPVVASPPAPAPVQVPVGQAELAASIANTGSAQPPAVPVSAPALANASQGLDDVVSVAESLPESMAPPAESQHDNAESAPTPQSVVEAPEHSAPPKPVPAEPVPAVTSSTLIVSEPEAPKAEALVLEGSSPEVEKAPATTNELSPSAQIEKAEHEIDTVMSAALIHPEATAEHRRLPEPVAGPRMEDQPGGDLELNTAPGVSTGASAANARTAAQHHGLKVIQPLEPIESSKERFAREIAELNRETAGTAAQIVKGPAAAVSAPEPQPVSASPAVNQTPPPTPAPAVASPAKAPAEPKRPVPAASVEPPVAPAVPAVEADAPAIIKHAGAMVLSPEPPPASAAADEDEGLPQAQSLAADDVAKARAERQATAVMARNPEPPVGVARPEETAEPVVNRKPAAAESAAAPAGSADGGSRNAPRRRHRGGRGREKPAEVIVSKAEAEHNQPTAAAREAGSMTGKLILPTGEKPAAELDKPKEEKPKKLAPGEVYVDEQGNVVIG
ncbi:MAG TPA: hypothetical protein VMT30_00915 [Candidatus Saccharimonadia bacterium]|nr:hypothetical protein [Candidatus Saccharimonadia bacterium]